MPPPATNRSMITTSPGSGPLPGPRRATSAPFRSAEVNERHPRFVTAMSPLGARRAQRLLEVEAALIRDEENARFVPTFSVKYLVSSAARRSDRFSRRRRSIPSARRETATVSRGIIVREHLDLLLHDAAAAEGDLERKFRGELAHLFRRTIVSSAISPLWSATLGARTPPRSRRSPRPSPAREKETPGRGDPRARFAALAALPLPGPCPARLVPTRPARPSERRFRENRETM